MHRKLWPPLCIMFLFLLLFPAMSLGTEGEEPGTDSTLIGRIPGYVMDEYDNKFGMLCPLNQNREELEPVEGTYTRFSYRESGKRQSSLAIIRTYSKKITQMGGVVLGENAAEGWGSWSLKKDEKEYWITVQVANDGQWYILEILEKGGLELELLSPAASVPASPINAETVSQRLEQDGKVALPVLFDTGKATLTPASFSILAEACTALRDKAGLKVYVDGHTDNQGNVQQNKLLSDQRAAAVQTALQLCGIDKGRLTARGFGQTQPVDDNGTEEGQSRNRRVELVTKK